MPQDNFWEPEIITNRKFKPISDTILRNLGISKESLKHVDNLEELRNFPPNIVIGKAVRSLAFMQNHFQKQILKKNNNYVMGLGVFQQVFSSPDFKHTYLKPASIKFNNLYRPYIGQDLTNKTLLVFRTGGIGDLLFIQPNLIYLKQKYPNCTIKFACGPQYQSMVETWECVDKVLDLPFLLGELISSDYHAMFEGVIERCKLAQTINSYNLFSKWLGLDLPDDMLVPSQIPKQNQVNFCMEKLNDWKLEDNNFILVQLRASSPIRTPGADIWGELFNKLIDKGFNIVITDTPRQSQNVDKFIDTFILNKDKIFNFSTHSLTLDYSIALTSLSKCVIATDSALSHIAASVDVPCYGLFGPFPGEIRLKTYPRTSWVNAVKECSPCYIHGPKPCPKAGRDGCSPCYENIDLDKTAEEIQELIEQNN